MKIAIIIPDRNDRPELLANCMRMIKAQTLQPDHIELVNDAPLNDKCDITYRYRIGYERLRGKGFDAILLMENDDWYSKDFIQEMVAAWLEHKQPDIIGTGYSLYYHLKIHAWFKMAHPRRSSAMSTLIKPDLNFPWCADHEPYTDMHLWRTLKGCTFSPVKPICISMKHNTGKTGGRYHDNYLHQFTNANGLPFLQQYLDPESFAFYSTFYKKQDVTLSVPDSYRDEGQ